MKEIKRAAVFPNRRKEIDAGKIGALLSVLSGAGIAPGLPYRYGTGDFADVPGLFRYDDADIRQGTADVLIVLGGDGSMIEAAHRTKGAGIPLIGINFGNVGYLTELEFDEAEALASLAKGEYSTEERMMLDAGVVSSDGTETASFTVLNDIVLTNGPAARLISFDIYCGETLMESCRADGAVIATPTGSTAYSLSAGGPVIDPKLSAVCVTPICPHTLGSRPVVLGADSEIRIERISPNGSTVYINADGRDVEKLEAGSSVRIRRSGSSVSLIRLRPHSFIGSLNSKLSGK